MTKEKILELTGKNLTFIVLPILLINLIFGALINLFVIFTVVPVIPIISIIISIIMNYKLCKGMKNKYGTQGDLYVEINIETPVGLNANQKQLLIEFEKSTKEKKYNPRISGFFDKMKRFF